GEERLYEAMRKCWHPVAYTNELGDRPVGVTLLGEEVVLARLGGEVRAFRDLCVHRGTRLSLGWIEGDQLRCAYHGWIYGSDGVCTAIPARHGPTIPSRAKLQPYSAAEQGGLIWVCLEPEPLFPVPELPEYGDPAYALVQVPTYDWACDAARR